MEIVKRSDDIKGFVVLPRRWVVERTFSWFGRNRRLAKDFENLTETLATFVTLASIQLALRRLARALVLMMEETFAGAPGNDRDAPIPDIPVGINTAQSVAVGIRIGHSGPFDIPE